MADKIVDFTTVVINEEMQNLRKKYPARRDSEKRAGARAALEACRNKTEHQLQELLLANSEAVRDLEATLAISKPQTFMGKDLPEANLIDFHRSYQIHVQFVLDSLKAAHLNEPRSIPPRQ